MSCRFGAVIQNGFVVRDIEAAMHHWATVLGIGPWFHVPRLTMSGAVHRGRPTDVEISIALANSGDLQLELIQQLNDAPSPFKEFLDAGHEGLQHMAFASHGLAADLERLNGEGYSVIYRCDVVGRGALAYLATESHPGTMVELVEMTPGRRAVYQRVADAARNWNGADPVRRS